VGLVALAWACTGAPASTGAGAGGDAEGGDLADSGDTGAGGTDTAEDPGVDSAEEPHEPLTLCINEWMPSNDAAAYDERGLAGDWVELANPGDDAVDLLGWSLSDDAAEPDKHRVSDSLVVPPGGFLLLWADSDPTAGPTHLDFSLAGSGGEIGLYNPPGDGSRVTYAAMDPDFSVARRTDCCTGESCFEVTWRGTPGASNEG
jgi:hypothetical protein